MPLFEHDTDATDVEKHAHTRQADISGEFDGQRHWSWAKWKFYTAPTINAAPSETGISQLYRHRDFLSRKTFKPKDVLRYLSPTNGKPSRMLVQATKEAFSSPSGDWRRRELEGNGPALLRLSSWVLEEVITKRKGDYTSSDCAVVAGKVLLVLPLQLLILSFPVASGAPVFARYKAFPDRCWDYPRYARNELLDAKPDAPVQATYESHAFSITGEYARYLRPRRLVFLRDKGTFVEPDRSEENLSDVPYLFISYTREHFDPDHPETCEPLYQAADRLTREAGLNAYWLDHLCITQEKGAEQSEDINRISDVIRGARQVIVVVPDLRTAALAVWGSRVWTLPEALLCQNAMIKFYTPSGRSTEKSKIALADEVWRGDQTGRLLAEHFSGSLSLSRLELIKKALEALSCRRTSRFADGDLAYALMGLLGHRPRANPNDTQFQALARLSLANDSDRIVERMMCMLPDPGEHNGGSRHNNKFVLKDQLGANLWDIEPLCQVAGVCDGSAVILDGCRGASIRWKDIPSIAYLNKMTWTRFFIAVGVHSGPAVFVVGATYVHYNIVGALFLVIGLMLMVAAPWSIMMLYGGKVWGTVPWLVGFEGTLPIKEIERKTFGNAIGRLSYAPSSSLLQVKDPNERVGKGPLWIEGSAPKPQPLPGQRFFTLIDTGTMTVSVFAAERPPSVAIIVGREGGMLRVALCHYERSTATLFKETVLRMETPMLDYAGLLGWIKVG